MASLQVRELPENIYQLLLREAKREKRSLAQEAVAVLARGLQASADAPARRRKLLAEIAKNRPGFSVPHPTALIRQDREQ